MAHVAVDGAGTVNTTMYIDVNVTVPEDMFAFNADGFPVGITFTGPGAAFPVVDMESDWGP